MTPGEYRDLQNRLNRSLAVRALVLLRVIPDPGSVLWGRVVTALFGLVLVQRRVSRDLALDYYASLSPTGRAPRVEPTPYEPEMTDDMLRRFVPTPSDSERAQTALETRARAARATAAVIRHGEQGGRESVLNAAREEGVRWARMDPKPPYCGFCGLLISRGPVYGSDSSKSGGFLAHDYDTCVPVPVWPGQDWPGREQYEQVERLYVENAAGLAGKDALAAMRRAVKTA